jgi:hypothetical protein
MIRMGLFEAMFFDKEQMSRMFRDFPLIYFSTTAAAITQYVVTAHPQVIDVNYFFPIIAILFVTFGVMVFFLLGYLFISRIIK